MNPMSKPKFQPSSKPEVMLSPSMIDGLKQQHPQHEVQLALAAHCVMLATCSAEDEGRVIVDGKIEQIVLAEWLLDCVELMPERIWDRLRNGVVQLFELLSKQYPKDAGIFTHLVVLSNPVGYSLQKRINREEELVDLLQLDGQPLLMEAIGLPDDCVRDHAGMAAPVRH